MLDLLDSHGGRRKPILISFHPQTNKGNKTFKKKNWLRNEGLYFIYCVLLFTLFFDSFCFSLFYSSLKAIFDTKLQNLLGELAWWLSMVVMRHHDQDNLWDKEFIWCILFHAAILRGSVAAESQVWHWKSCWELMLWCLNRKQGGRERQEPFETSKSIPSVTPLLGRPHCLILPKHFHQLRVKYSKIWTYRRYSLLVT